MEEQISSTFTDKDNKLEISKDSNKNDVPKFEDIVDIKKYNNTIDETLSTKYESTTETKEKKLKFCCKKLGHTLCLFSDKMGNPFIMIGPHWLMYVIFCGAVTTGYILFSIFFWKKLNLFMIIIGIATLCLYFISYTGTFLLNPGYPERNEESLLGKPRIKYKYCEYCDIWERVDMNITHCFECGVCVEGFDHHCPWTGKCIGRKNIYYFNTFLASVFISFIYFVLALVFIDINND